MTIKPPDLPSSNSPTLHLLHPTEEEKLKTWKLNGQSWRGRLSMDAYVRRDQHLANQALTREGGITYWILVDSSKPPNSRIIFGSCESLRKRALVARGKEPVREAVSYGICSVFCNPSLRGRGHALRMMQELGKRLDLLAQVDGRTVDFTMLYSDIGKVNTRISIEATALLIRSQTFYAKAGWMPFTSSQIALRPVARNEQAKATLPDLAYLKAHDLPWLCDFDVRNGIRKGLEKSRADPNVMLVALEPNVESIQWHHAREEFVAQELLGKFPEVKGVSLNGMWCIWSHFFGNESNGSGNTLHILRFFLGDSENGVSNKSDPVIAEKEVAFETGERIDTVATLLEAAQHDAAEWDMHELQIWNPIPIVVAAAQTLDPSVRVVHREEDSIACLKLHKPDPQITKVEWIANEKYGWC